MMVRGEKIAVRNETMNFLSISLTNIWILVHTVAHTHTHTHTHTYVYIYIYSSAQWCLELVSYG